jgi:hypothetical protein
MVIVLDPFFENDPDRVGWSTSIGSGDGVSEIAAIAVAATVDVFWPMTRINIVSRVLCTLTQIRFTWSLPDNVTCDDPSPFRGTVHHAAVDPPATPGPAKSTVTWSVNVPSMNPFFLA